MLRKRVTLSAQLWDELHDYCAQDEELTASLLIERLVSDHLSKGGQRAHEHDEERYRSSL
ncbi:MAG: hypothetical protein AAGI11_17610 [Pseudomonadota bacterium]